MSAAITTIETHPVETLPASRTQPAVTPGSLLKMFRRRLILLVTVWGIVTSLTVGLTFYLDYYHRLYTASTLVKVNAPNMGDPAGIEQPHRDVSMMDRYVADQIVLLKDEETLRQVLESPLVRMTPWYREISERNRHLSGEAHAKATQKLAMESLEESIGGSQSPGTNFMVVTFSAGTPRDAADILNVIVERYLGQLETILRQRYSFELNEYQNREAELLMELDRLRSKKLGFVEAHMGVAGMTFGLNVAGETWQSLAAQVIQVEAQKLQYKAAYENLVGRAPEDIEIDPELRGMINRDPFITSLRNDKLNLEYEISLLRERLDNGHRKVRQKLIEIEVIDTRIEELIANREQEVRRFKVDSAHTLFLNAVQAELQLREEMIAAEELQRRIDGYMNEYRQIEFEQWLTQLRLQEVVEYSRQLDMMIQARRMIQVEQIEDAQPPLDPSFPDWRMFSMTGSFLGLLLGAGLAVLLEMTDNRFRTPDHLIRHALLPALGAVTDADDDEATIERIETVVRDHPSSIIAEEFRRIRTNLRLSLPAEQLHSLLITSPRPQEGKTTVAMNLAIAFSQLGDRVLLVDANFRKPRLYTLLDNPPAGGLSHYLTAQRGLRDLVVEVAPTLHCLAAGPIPPQGGEILDAHSLARFMAEVRPGYDQVIIDGPASLSAVECTHLARAVDGVVMVCMARETTRGVVNRARETLERAGARLLGGVLNGVQAQPGGYYRKEMVSYYDYHAQGHE